MATSGLRCERLKSKKGTERRPLGASVISVVYRELQFLVTVSSRFKTKFATSVHAAVSTGGATFFSVDSPA
jgi:hypothetical protein